VGQDSIVGIADLCGLDSWDKILRRQDFLNSSNWPWGPPSLLYSGYWVIPGVKQLGCGVNHLTPSSTKIKE